MPSEAGMASTSNLACVQTPLAALQSGLADQQLWDVLIARVLPELQLGVLGSLRGTCASLRDLLDSQHSNQFWSAAVGHRLHNQPHECSQPCTNCKAANADSSGRLSVHSSEQKGCSLCIQEQLRKTAQGVQRLGIGGKMLQWPRHPTFKLSTKSLHWSPCSRWVAAVVEGPKRDGQQVQKVLGKLNPEADIQYEHNISTVRIFDMKDPQDSACPTSQADFRASAAQTADWPIRTLHWIPQPQQDGSPWIVCTRQATIRRPTKNLSNPSLAPAWQHEEKYALYCLDVSGDVREVIISNRGRPKFKFSMVPLGSNQLSGSLHVLPSVSMAACWGFPTDDRAVTVYDLPRLQTRLSLKEANCLVPGLAENGVQFSPDGTKLAIWWCCYNWPMPDVQTLGVYDICSGMKLATFSDQLQSSADDRQLAYLLAWSPFSDRLLCTRRDSYYVLELLTGQGFYICIQPRQSFAPSRAFADCGWMPCGQAVLVMGQQTGNRVSSPDEVSMFAVSMDRSFIAKWGCFSAWQTIKQAFWRQDSINFPTLRQVLLAAWASSQHPLEPLWSQGMEGLLQPHDHLTALISSHVDSHLGLDFQPYSQCISLNSYHQPCRWGPRSQHVASPKLLPNGKLLVLAPVKLSANRGANQQPAEAYSPFCAHRVWNAVEQKMEHERTSWPAWTCFAWHPAAIFTSLYAIAAPDGTILVADARSSKVPVRSWSYAALRKFQWHPSRAEQALYPGGLDHYRRAIEVTGEGPCIWECMAWSPDGTKLFAAGDNDAVAIDFVQQDSRCTWATELQEKARACAQRALCCCCCCLACLPGAGTQIDD